MFWIELSCILVRVNLHDHLKSWHRDLGCLVLWRSTILVSSNRRIGLTKIEYGAISMVDGVYSQHRDEIGKTNLQYLKSLPLSHALPLPVMIAYSKFRLVEISTHDLVVSQCKVRTEMCTDRRIPELGFTNSSMFRLTAQIVFMKCDIMRWNETFTFCGHVTSLGMSRGGSNHGIFTHNMACT
jgi:hypothetical protein